MNRSFSDRVLGGVCGGLGSSWRVNPWWLRLIFVAFSFASLGVGVLLYLGLWWALPQESLIVNQRGGVFALLMLIVLLIVIFGAWIIQITGNLTAPNGQALLYPIALMTISIVFLLRTVRG
ncbi:MAG: PspC domain-containing protein [Aggregatilineales bacterium]